MVVTYEKYRVIMVKAVNELVNGLVSQNIPLSLTITGPSLESRRMESVNDIDIILVFSENSRYKSVLDVAYKVQTKFSKNDAEIVIAPRYGPVRPQPEKGKWKLQFQIMVYTPERLKRISPVSCLARYSWQFEKAFFGEPFKKYFSLDRINADNLLNAHWGILHCIECIRNDRREYWEWVSSSDDKFGLKLEHFLEPINSAELLFEFYAYCITKCAMNYLSVKTGKPFSSKLEVVEKFAEEFQDKSFSGYPAQILKEQSLVRQGKLLATQRFAAERKIKALNFLESMKKAIS